MAGFGTVANKVAFFNAKHPKLLILPRCLPKHPKLVCANTPEEHLLYWAETSFHLTFMENRVTLCHRTRSGSFFGYALVHPHSPHRVSVVGLKRSVAGIANRLRYPHPPSPP